MIKSMTGYGRGTVEQDGLRVVTTVRTVNSRYLDIKLRGVELEPDLENEIRDMINKRLVRGTVQIQLDVTRTDNGKQTLVFNRTRYEAIEDILLKIQKEYGRHLEMSDIVSAGDLYSLGQGKDLPKKPIVASLKKAMDSVENMRRQEGDRLHNDMENRLSVLKDHINTIEANLAEINKERLTKLQSRLKDLLGDNKVDEQRLAQEVALLADRADITEELVRCRSHFEQFQHFMGLKEPIGKRLNFLLQEIGREINTIGSKSDTSKIVNTIIDMKSEVEKIREQVQNVL